MIIGRKETEKTLLVNTDLSEENNDFGCISQYEPAVFLVSTRVGLLGAQIETEFVKGKD